MLEKLFKLRENGTDVRTEVMAGITTFMTMAYILAVNPSILSATGMDSGAIFTSTALAAMIGTFLMAFFANYPFALAPGMGLNAYFAYTVVLGMGYKWEVALTAVFVEGIVFIVLSLTDIREAIFNAIPKNLKSAVSVGIGLFIEHIGQRQDKSADPRCQAGVIGGHLFADIKHGNVGFVSNAGQRVRGVACGLRVVDKHVNLMFFQQFLEFLKIVRGWFRACACRLQVSLRRVVGEPHVAEQIVGHRFGGGVGDVLMRVAERLHVLFYFLLPPVPRGEFVVEIFLLRGHDAAICVGQFLGHGVSGVTGEP